MAIVKFEQAQVLAVRAGKSQKGTDWSRLQFLDKVDLQVYEVMSFGPESNVFMGLVRGCTYSMDWSVTPARDGGVQLTLIAADLIS